MVLYFLTMKDELRICLNNALARAGGKKVSLARAASVTRQAIEYWFRIGYVPQESVKPLVEKLGMGRHELRPDIWEPPHAALCGDDERSE